MLPGLDWVSQWEAEDEHKPILDNQVANESPEVLRVGTYNVKFAENPDVFAERILTDPELAKVHVWLLQEIDSFPDEPLPRAEAMAQALDMNFAFAPARAKGNGFHGLAILSKLPLENLRIMQLPQPQFSFNTRRRIAFGTDIFWNNQTIELVNIHLDTRINPSVRITQMDPAVRSLSDVAIIGGDTNDNGFHWTENVIPNVPADLALGDSVHVVDDYMICLLYTSPSPRDATLSRMPSSA